MQQYNCHVPGQHMWANQGPGPGKSGPRTQVEMRRKIVKSDYYYHLKFISEIVTGYLLGKTYSRAYINVKESVSVHGH